MPLDYRGPAAKLILIRRQGVRFTEDDALLRQYGIPEIPGAIDLSTFFQSVEITLPIASETGMYRCEVQLASNYEDGIRLLNSFVSDFGNQLRVTIGYGGPGQESYKLGPIVFFTHWPGFEYGTQTQFTIKGIGAGAGDLSRKVRSTIWKATQLTMAQIVSVIASDHRLRVVFGKRPGDETDTIVSGKIPAALNRRLTQDWPQQGKTDHQLLLDLCREGSSEFQIENGLLFVYDKDENRSKKPVGTLVFFGQIDTAKNRWPITQFSLQGNMWFRPGGADGHQFRTGIDPRTGKRVQDVVLDPSQADVTHDGDKVAAGAEFLQQNNTQAFTDPGAVADGGGGSVVQIAYANAFFNGQTSGEITPEGTETNTPNKRQQAVRDNAQGAGLLATCETPGNPMLRAGQIVRVEGGGRLAGNYFVKKVVHKLDSGGGFSTSLELMRNVAGPDDPALVSSGAPSLVSSSTEPTAKRTNTNRAASQDGGGQITVRARRVEPFGSASNRADPFR